MSRKRLYPYDLQICLDSGAYSIYHSNMRKQGAVGVNEGKKLGAFDFAKSAEFTEYMDRYIEYLIDTRKRYSFYVTLDVIYNDKLSWETFKILYREGLTPVPVFHAGSDPSYLKRYLDKCDYIGLSGLGTSHDKAALFLDRIFKDYLQDKRGAPLCKVHGFAMTSARTMARYPWYSTDSTSWGFASRYGGILMPQPLWKDSQVCGFSFLGNMITLRVTKRTTHLKPHISKLGQQGKVAIDSYLNIFDKSLGNLEDLEDITLRDLINCYYMLNLEKELKDLYNKRWGYKQGANVYMSGNTTESLSPYEIRTRLLGPLSELIPGSTFRYMGTFFELRLGNTFFDASLRRI